MRFCRPVSNLLRAAALMAAASSAYAGGISVERPYPIHGPIHESSSIQQTRANQQSSARTLQTKQQRHVADVSARYDARAPSSYVAYSDRSTDALPMTLVAAMLVAYQLRRKHRFLRPRPFLL